MESSKLATLISFAAYTSLIIIIGLTAFIRRKRTNEDFFLAGRSFGPWISALSSAASTESGWVLLGLVGAAFTGGISTLWLIPGCIAGYYFNWTHLAPKIRKYSNDTKAITLPDLISARFIQNKLAIRLITVFIMIVAMLGYVSAQMTAAGKAFSASFNVSYEVGVVLGALIVVIYTFSGGFRAVAWTDLIQALFMVTTLVVLPVYFTLTMGGIDELWMNLKLTDDGLLSLFGQSTGWAIIGLVLGWSGIGLGYPGQPHAIVRYMATKDDRSIKRGKTIAITWAFFVFLGAILLGLVGKAYYASLSDPEQTLPLMASDLLPGVLAGFVLAAIVAAISSTADSQLIVLVGTVTHDMYYRIFHRNMPEDRMDKINRMGVIVLGILTALFAMTETRIVFTFVLYAWSVLGASIGTVLILTFFYNKYTSYGAISSLMSGAIITVAWREKGLSDYIYELVPAFIGALLLGIIVSRLEHRYNLAKSA